MSFFDQNSLSTFEPYFRFGSFIAVFLIISLWEIFAPKRIIQHNKLQRWTTNFMLLTISILVLRLIFPIAAIGIATLANQHGWGIFNYLKGPAIFIFPLSYIILDLSIYWQHRLFHKIPLLWKLHKVHHTDLDLDCSSGIRFHPIEILLSIFIKSVIIITFGIPIEIVLIFEITLNTTALFNHGNIVIPSKVDTCLRKFIVTPDMHRVHHSNIANETNSNYSFTISWWDKIFDSYTGQPAKGHQNMTLGLKEYPEQNRLKLLSLLIMPFKQPKDGSNSSDAS